MESIFFFFFSWSITLNARALFSFCLTPVLSSSAVLFFHNAFWYFTTKRKQEREKKLSNCECEEFEAKKFIRFLSFFSTRTSYNDMWFWDIFLLYSCLTFRRYFLWHLLFLILSLSHSYWCALLFLSRIFPCIFS